MDHLLPTLLGLAGALAPVALEFWRRERATVGRMGRSSRYAPAGNQLFIEDAVVRGGRVYL